MPGHRRKTVWAARSCSRGGELSKIKRINEYLGAASLRDDADGPIFRPVKNPITGDLEKPLSPEAVYTRIVKHHARGGGVNVPGFCVHARRATAATNPRSRRHLREYGTPVRLRS